jgi:hypothetical protein
MNEHTRKEVPLDLESVQYLPGIRPRQHHVRYSATRDRYKWPFKGMILGDYCLIFTAGEARAARAALRSFYKRQGVGRRFYVHQEADGVWVCRRIQ